MTDSLTRAVATRWPHGAPVVAVALRAAAARLLPGSAAAEDVYLRAGIGLTRPADTQFTDADCSSMVPAALYGCGLRGDGASERIATATGSIRHDYGDRFGWVFFAAGFAGAVRQQQGCPNQCDCPLPLRHPASAPSGWIILHYAHAGAIRATACGQSAYAESHWLRRRSVRGADTDRTASGAVPATRPSRRESGWPCRANARPKPST